MIERTFSVHQDLFALAACLVKSGQKQAERGSRQGK
jgi:hypothetical protein